MKENRCKVLPSVKVGRGRSEGVIPIIGKGPEVRAKKTDEGVVLVRGELVDDGGRCLAVINTCGAYSQYRSYTIRDAEGVQEISLRGNFALGSLAEPVAGDEILAIVMPGCDLPA